MVVVGVGMGACKCIYECARACVSVCLYVHVSL